MLGEIATMTGYVKAPRTTYRMKHPIRAMRMARVRRDLGNTFTGGRLAIGLGVIAAVPLAIWAGRRIAAARREGAASENE